MNTRSKDPGNEPGGRDPAAQARFYRRLIVGGVLVLVAAFAFMIWQAIQEDSQAERWDILEALRNKHEPAQDPIWENPYGVYNPERERYIEALKAFLDAEAKDADGALEPHTRFVLAKTIADHILANPGILDQEDRGEFYAEATAQLEAIHEDHPDFPTNWTMLSSEGFPSLTRRFIQWLKDNQAWEQEHMLQPAEPTGSVRVLVRTDRGDLLLGLYTETAPNWTKAFVERAVNGHYDGTCFTEKRDIGDASEPGEHAVRAGGSASRGLEPFNLEAHRELSEAPTRSGLLPEESRNRMPFERGIVAAWHAGGDEYDHAEQLLLVSSRSPYLDYKYTPIGKLLNEGGVDSLLTLDRIFGGVTWRDDKVASGDTEMRAILDWFQAPARIVKVLVYEDGTLKTPAEGAVTPTKAATEDSEGSLAGIKADRYKQEPPARPEKKDAAPKDGDDDPKQDAPRDGDGK